ncbi:WD domain protein [Sporothrix brasiliensis 5110]|uniref:WD domain protein n=1 Tax=Sporothrix brasiliensis 5110 TaxID=1398154 RepID=A0A0C2ICB0_9PEZI|nr:WD domain protein [Sporothrix brasiliensis 5110]KIH86936.1 WD domain protein [Sporothrix brasiliensis 5110]
MVNVQSLRLNTQPHHHQFAEHYWDATGVQSTTTPTTTTATPNIPTDAADGSASLLPPASANPRRRRTTRSGTARINTLRPTRQVLGRRRRSAADEDEQDIADAQVEAQAQAQTDEDQDQAARDGDAEAVPGQNSQPGGDENDGDVAGNEATARNGNGDSNRHQLPAPRPKRARRESANTMLAASDAESQLASMNGSSHLQNGKDKATTRRGPASNGPSQVTRRPATYYGHDREEITRILIQALSDLGYNDAAENVSHSSGFALESPAVADFRRAVLGGDWDEAERLLLGATVEGTEPSDTSGQDDQSTTSPANGQTASGAPEDATGLLLIPGTNRDLMRFGIRQQKYLEYLEQSETAKALLVLRNELTPLYRDTQKLHFLSSLLMCHSPLDLKTRATWDGAYGQSRPHLLSELSRFISPSVMLPEHRLAVLLRQIKDYQVSGCVFHTSATSPSLYADHECDKSNFPSHMLYELDSNSGEVWHIRFSNNGKFLASCGSGRYVNIYDMSSFKLKMRLDGHAQGVGDIAWSPDDRTLLSCGRDGRARLWDMSTGLLIRLFEQFEEPISCCVWANDGQSIVLGSFDKDRALVQWGVGGERLHTWTRKHRTEALALSPDGFWLVAMDHEKRLHVYNFLTMELEYDMELDSRAFSIAISRDSEYLLVNRQDGAIHMYNLSARGEPVRKYLGATGGDCIIRSSFGGADESFVISGSEAGRMLSVSVYATLIHHTQMV